MRFVSPLFRRGRNRAATIAVVVLVVAGAVGLMFARGKAASPQYRTAAATLGTIRQTLSLTGNLTPVAQSNVNFAVAGTITAIDVTVGQTVTAGQVLATLDSTSLQTALTLAQANLSAALAKQAADGSSAAGSTAAQQLASAQTSLANDQTAYNDTVAVDNQTIRNDQRAIAAAQASVAADDQSVAQAKHKYSTDACTSSSTSATCQSDQQNLSAAEQQLSKDQQSLAAAQAALSTDEVRGQQANDQAAARVAADRTALSNAESASGSANSSASQAASAAQDMAAVTQAQLAVTTAQNAVNNATLVAPAAGQVAQINTAVGSTVSGSATSQNSSASAAATQFIILTPGSFQVTGTVSDSVISEVAIGQRAAVTPAGSPSGLAGTVTSVGVIATVSSGVATFPVTVQITGTHPALRDGMSASVTVVINEVVGVLTVPTSAVHTNGTTSTVEVLKNGAPTPVVVTVGAADASRTEITSGLAAGDTVVIATVTSTVPSAGTGSGVPRRAGGGAFPGGGQGIVVGGG